MGELRYQQDIGMVMVADGEEVSVGVFGWDRIGKEGHLVGDLLPRDIPSYSQSLVDRFRGHCVNCTPCMRYNTPL